MSEPTWPPRATSPAGAARALAPEPAQSEAKFRRRGARRARGLDPQQGVDPADRRQARSRTRRRTSRSSPASGAGAPRRRAGLAEIPHRSRRRRRQDLARIRHHRECAAYRSQSDRGSIRISEPDRGVRNIRRPNWPNHSVRAAATSPIRMRLLNLPDDVKARLERWQPVPRAMAGPCWASPIPPRPPRSSSSAGRERARGREARATRGASRPADGEPRRLSDPEESADIAALGEGRSRASSACRSPFAMGRAAASCAFATARVEQLDAICKRLHGKS